ncbi:hypothetical protein LTS18_013951, partial [Coniosporium uncinatum]
KVVVAKVDATANDVPDEIQGFPTIKMFPAGKKSDPVSYSGSRTVEDLVQFIKENGSHGIDANGSGKEELKREETGMPEQAPAATKKSGEAADKAADKTADKAADKATEKAEEATEGVKEKVGKVAEKVMDGAEKVKEILVDADDAEEIADGHDEL